MVAIAFPETQAIVVEEHEAADPLDAFPGVEMRNDEAERAAVIGAERLAVMFECEENIRAEQIR